MALEPGHRPTSPTTSGRSSPVPWLLRKGAEESLYRNDKSFRRYAQSIERALSFFDTPQQEWADYISFLARLLKALQAHPGDIHAIPHSATVATRLAQCMNPALPSGVHQKTLDVYNIIFTILGKDSLSRDFNLYFPGLAALPSFASLNVRPYFVSLVEEHILTLNPEALRPALKSIILCLLPGLEEETSEDFERLVQALDKLSFAVKLETEIDAQDKEEPDSYFWQCLFLAAITNPPRRQGALAYLVRRLPKFGSSSNNSGGDSTSDAEISKSAQVVISPEPGLLIRCFAAGLADDQILIQRGFLDLLVTRLPLDSTVLRKKVGQADLERLVAAAAGVVARRDMSLNRRLWSWFLGPEPSAGAEENETGDAGEETSQSAIYLSRYGLRPLIRSMLAMIKKDTLAPAVRARPFRICLSLMDRWEVGGLVVPEIFIPALQSVEKYSHLATKEQVDEVMRSASIFFDGVESGLIWGKLLELMAFALKPSSSAGDEQTSRLKLARFIVNRFNVREEEMLIHHMPLMIIAVLYLTTQYISQGQDSRFYSPDVATKALDFIDWMVQHIPERALQSPVPSIDQSKRSAEPGEVFDIISNFYFKSQGNLDVQDTPLSVNDQAYFVVSLAGTLFSSVLLGDRSSSMVEVVSRLLATLLHKSRNFDGLQDLDILSVLHKALNETTSSPIDSSAPYHLVVAISTVLIPLQTAQPSNPIVEHAELPSLIHPLVNMLWHYLSPWRPKYHVESVRCLWQLHSLSASSRLVESSITSLMCSSTFDSAKEITAEAGSRFAVLWTHTINERGIMQAEKGSRPPSRSNSTMALESAVLSAGGIQPLLTRPLFRILDALEGEGSEIFVFVRSWLGELPSLGKIFELLATHVRSLEVLKRNGDALQSTLRPTAVLNSGSSTTDDIRECLYHLKTILNLLRWSSAHTWTMLVGEKVSPLDSSQLHAEPVALQVFITQLSMRALAVVGPRSGVPDETVTSELHRTAVAVLKHVLTSPQSDPLKEFELEIPLMSLIRVSSPPLQSMLLETIIPALKLRYQRPKLESDGRKPSRDIVNTLRRISISQDGDKDEQSSNMPPPQLIECLRSGFTSPSSRLILDEWVKFLAEVLPLFENSIFQNLLPLVEIFCGQIDEIFDRLRSTFKTTQSDAMVPPESSLVSLMNGLEQILEKAHGQLIVQESKPTTTKSPELQQGFFGSVAGVFSTETAPQTRSSTANNRLTVILCFQDTVRICFSIWSWNGYSASAGKQDGSSQASFSYSSLRLRNRARRILEHLFAAEGLECLETLAVIWCQSTGVETRSAAVLGLLSVLNGGQPKHTIPAIFNAIYSRTSPGALELSRTSTLTSDLSDIDLVAFLVAYTSSLEDDAMDEIWPDCMTFLKDLLGNPMPHRQILPTLLEFIALLARKVDNTSLGEQRRMRKELGDLFTRLLTATFTTRSLGFLQDPSQTNILEKSGTEDSSTVTRANRAVDVVSILASIVPDFSLVLIENDRITNLATAISTNIIAPSIRSKAFPTNISDTMLDLLYRLSRATQSSKAIKKDIFDAFNDPRFFSFSFESIKLKWLPLLQHWSISDKERIPELLSRLFAPTTAGIIGFGATSARLEADRKTQLNLRRICLLITSGVEDAFVPILPSLQEKLVELLAATPSTSPSSATRAEIFMVFRALILKTSPVPLAPLWPIINAELTIAISAVIPDDESHELYNNHSILMACKLLNTLIALAPEEFQLHEWLYIADTIDAVYRPTDMAPTALTDAVAESLADTTDYAPLSDSAVIDDAPSKPDAEVPLLDSIIARVEADMLLQRSDTSDDIDVAVLSRPELAARVLRPFFGQLSLWAFEERYAMRSIEGEVWIDDLLRDLCGGGGGASE